MGCVSGRATCPAIQGRKCAKEALSSFALVRLLQAVRVAPHLHTRNMHVAVGVAMLIFAVCAAAHEGHSHDHDDEAHDHAEDVVVLTDDTFEHDTQVRGAYGS